jgi:hypothetical protein
VSPVLRSVLPGISFCCSASFIIFPPLLLISSSYSQGVLFTQDEVTAVSAFGEVHGFGLFQLMIVDAWIQ